MNTNLVTMLMVVGTLGGIASGLAETKTSSAAATATVAPPPASGPKIQFDETVYDFGKVTSGEVVKHTFVFTNTGTVTLEIKDVKAGCGCTTAGTWDKLVEPGKTGSIPLQFNSVNFGGTIAKQATVMCNDPGQSNVVLQIKGIVWKPIEVTPPTAFFNVSSETQTNETKVVRIVSNLEEPLTLSDLQCTNQTFKAELKTVRPGKEFELHITSLPPFNSTPIIAPVSLKTSATNMPTINVSAYVIVQQTVVVMPNQFMLPAGPLAAPLTNAVAIRNNGTNALVLSDASVNVPGAEVRVQESQPGRQFSLVASFPAGLQIRPDQKIEVSVKSNHPKYPLLKVPVFQPQAPPVPAASQSVSAPVAVAPPKPAPPATGGK